MRKGRLVKRLADGYAIAAEGGSLTGLLGRFKRRKSCSDLIINFARKLPLPPFSKKVFELQKGQRKKRIQIEDRFFFI